MHDDRFLRLCLAALVLGALTGCGPSKSQRARNEKIDNDTMERDVSLFTHIYFVHEEVQGKPDANWGEFMALCSEPRVDKFRKNEFEVMWGASLAAYAAADDDLGMYVLMHDKNAATQGGWVGMADQSARRVTADEFKALPLLGRTAPGSLPAANMQQRLSTLIGELKSNDAARADAAVARLSSCRRKAPRQDVAEALLALRKPDSPKDEQKVVEELCYWATSEHDSMLRALWVKREYDSEGMRQARDSRYKKQQQSAKMEADRRRSEEEFAKPQTQPEEFAKQREEFAQRAEEQRKESEARFAEHEKVIGSPRPGRVEEKLSDAEIRARRIADLKSGEFFKVKGAAEQLQNSVDAVPDEELTGLLVQLLSDKSTFVRSAAAGALKKWGTESCLAPLRATLKSGGGSVFEKRDTVALIGEIEKRLGLADEPGEPIPASKRLKPGDKVFAQTPGGLIAGKIVQVLPKGVYRVTAGEEGFEQTGDFLTNQLRSVKKPAGTAAKPAAGSAATNTAGAEKPALKADPLAPRAWTDASGKFAIVAEFIALVDGQVQLKKKADGQIITLPLEKLSPADQEFVRNISGR